MVLILCLYFLKEVIFAYYPQGYTLPPGIHITPRDTHYPQGYTLVYCLGPCQGPPSDVGNTDIQRLQELAHKPIRHLKCLNLEGPHLSTYILLAV